jgi:hypothetical protein
VYKRDTCDTKNISSPPTIYPTITIIYQSHPKPLKAMSIKQFFSEHAMLYNAKVEMPEKPESKERYHVDVEVAGTIEEPVIAPEKVSVFKSYVAGHKAIWAAKTKAAKAPAPPAGETKYTLDHEMDALNLWSPWAAKTKAAKGMAPLTERERENIKNKSWTV